MAPPNAPRTADAAFSERDAERLGELVVDLALDRLAIGLGTPEGELLRGPPNVLKTPEIPDADYITSLACLARRPSELPDGVVRIQVSAWETPGREESVTRMDVAIATADYGHLDVGGIIKEVCKRSGIQMLIEVGHEPPRHLSSSQGVRDRLNRHIEVSLSGDAVVIQLNQIVVKSRASGR